MGLVIVRIFFLIFSGMIGYYFSVNLSTSSHAPFIGILVGVGVALFVLGIEIALKKTPVKGLIAGSVGLMAGFILANLITRTVIAYPFTEPVAKVLQVAISLAVGYLGMMLAWRKREEFKILFPKLGLPFPQAKKWKILDTSVIIDGRIADIVEAGFIEGTIVIPKFILGELQKIADSADSLRRKRGRRGLDVLGRMQKIASAEVVIEEKDIPQVREVDAKLVKLAKLMGGKIITNDYNLNKVAKLQEVEVLNINELASALKPVILPSEDIKIRVVKGGKEPSQGVAYLDDGTMVVVEDGKNLIGEEVDVEVTSVLQTSAGRMIFAQHKKGSYARRR